MSYSLELSHNNGAESIVFPVLPEKIEVSQGENSKSYEISGFGEISVLTGKKLTEISFSGIFPATPLYPGPKMNEIFYKPVYYYQKIEEWMTDQKIVELVFTGSTLNLNLPVSIESFTYSESGGAVGDIKYDLKLKQYRFYSAQKVLVGQKDGSSTAVKQSPARADTREQPKTYTLAAGDSLWKIAQKILGNGARYKEIQKLNSIKDSELRRLPVGKVLKLP